MVLDEYVKEGIEGFMDESWEFREKTGKMVETTFSLSHTHTNTEKKPLVITVPA